MTLDWIYDTLGLCSREIEEKQKRFPTLGHFLRRADHHIESARKELVAFEEAYERLNQQLNKEAESRKSGDIPF